MRKEGIDMDETSVKSSFLGLSIKEENGNHSESLFEQMCAICKNREITWRKHGSIFKNGRVGKKRECSDGEMSMRSEGKVRFVGVVEKASEEEAELRVFPEFCSALRGIENFSHIIVLYWFHLRDDQEHRSTLQVIPRRHKCASQVGVFACRSPSRPNPLGLCTVELVNVKDSVLRVKGLDAVADSPLIDIKPYIPRSDCVRNARVPEWTSEGPKT